MATGNPNPKNLSDLVQAGAMDTAVELRDKGYSGARLRDRLSRLFPNAFSQSIRALADRSIAVIQAIRRFFDAPKTEDVKAIDPPLVEGADPGITATFGIDYTPKGAQETITLHTKILNSETMTVDQLEEVGFQRLQSGALRETGCETRIRLWIEKKQRETGELDTEAAAKLAEFRSRLHAGTVRITSIFRGKETK